MAFPQQRLRRLRTTSMLRSLVQETHLQTTQFIYPLFVCEGEGIKREISSMPGVFQWSIDLLVMECKEVSQLGIPGVILFGIPNEKDSCGSDAIHSHGIIQRAIRAIKAELPQLLVITDVCMCEYTSHGHCGILEGEEVDNDKTIPYLVKQAIIHAQCGADIIAPSDMMDGRVGAIRKGLDENGFSHIPIMAYSAKYASSFYGPFREAAQSTPQFGDRKSYQMNPANSQEALREIALDIEEGADFIMVKPALSYLDIIQRASTTFNIPIVAYNVSGEYAMIKAAAQLGWLDEKKAMEEMLLSIKRAGAAIIITYFAKDIATILAKR